MTPGDSDATSLGEHVGAHDHAHAAEPQLYGLVAEFDDSHALVEATKNTYRAGYRRIDAYSPMPIHGLAEAMGVRRTLVPFLTLCAGMTGAAAGFGMQWFACTIHYPYDIGGKPYFSWPSFIPITFECMVLFGAFTAAFSMILLNGLPRPHHAIFNAKNFERATSDRFFLAIESEDTLFDAEKTAKFLKEQNPLDVSEVPR